MKGLVLDAGNALIKARSFSGGELSFPHAFTMISKSQYDDTVKSYNGDVPNDFMRIGDKFYVVGESAERFGVVQHDRGTSRYHRDYIGVLAISAIARSYSQSTELAVFASHPPGHVNYADDLMNSIGGSWDVEIRQAQLKFNINYMNVYDEPTGGLMNVFLTEDGRQYVSNDFRGASILVIDVGGGTTDWVVVNEAGEVDYGVAHTEPLGISDVVDTFKTSFKARYKELTKSVNVLDPKRIRDAIITGEFKGGGQKLPCEEEAAQARNTLINLILRVTRNRFSGGFNYDAVLLTGGGNALLSGYLWNEIENENIHLASDRNELHMANVRGGHKLWKLYKTIGVV